MIWHADSQDKEWKELEDRVKEESISDSLKSICPAPILLEAISLHVLFTRVSHVYNSTWHNADAQKDVCSSEWSNWLEFGIQLWNSHFMANIHFFPL